VQPFGRDTHMYALQGMVKSVVTSSSTTMGSRQQKKEGQARTSQPYSSNKYVMSRLAIEASITVRKIQSRDGQAEQNKRKEDLVSET